MDADQLAIALPWPPSVNHYYRHLPTGRGRMSVVLGEEGRVYRSLVLHRWRQGAYRAPMAGPIALTMRLARPDRITRDLDNLCKCVLDALRFASVYDDDSQIHDLRVLDTYRIVAGGSIAVEVTPLPVRDYEDARP